MKGGFHAFGFSRNGAEARRDKYSPGSAIQSEGFSQVISTGKYPVRAFAPLRV